MMRWKKLIVADIKSADVESRVVSGYASTFESAENYDAYGDIIDPGAFDNSIRDFKAGLLKVKMLSQHESPIGLWHSLNVDKRGLWVEGKLSKTREADETLELIKDGVIDGLSIGFEVRRKKDLEVMTEWGTPVRLLQDIKLMEVSPVTWPANEQAKILEVRSARRKDFDRVRRSNDIVDMLLSINLTKANVRAERFLTALKRAGV